MPSYFAGMMSGTSLDAVDGLLIGFKEGCRPQIINQASVNLPTELKDLLTFLAHAQEVSFRQLAQAEDSLTRAYAKTAHQLLDKIPSEQQPLALGCHGQTIEHQPYANPSYTLQILNPSLLAELTGKNIICDFRRRDLAAGGQAAPLVPAFHQEVFSSEAKNRIIINLGGVANLTYLPNTPNAKVLGFDTGPANLLLDYWHQKNWGVNYDAQGEQAARGQLIPSLLNLAMQESFFSLPAPKSTGRELFNPTWLNNLLDKISLLKYKPEDVQRTLTEITALSLSNQIKALDPKAEAELFICGGGWHNTFLIERIRALNSPRQLEATDNLGIPTQDVEAAAFAWLAWRHWERKTGNLPSVTGAQGARILGGFYPA